MPRSHDMSKRLSQIKREFPKGLKSYRDKQTGKKVRKPKPTLRVNASEGERITFKEFLQEAAS